MSGKHERQGPDRRQLARGGRRPEDVSGYAPLVLVAYEEPVNRQMCEMILAKLHFAVAPVASVDQALAVIPTLQPDIVVARVNDMTLLRHAADGIPLVEVTDAMLAADNLISAIRRTLRDAHAE